MKLHFDPNQAYQRAAVDAVISLFRGLGPASSVSNSSLGASSSPLTVAGGVANSISLEDDQILQNLRSVQRANGITESTALDGLDFSVEMETGTGKTYVYLRTILELHRAYGLTKFIVVVPNVAIKEGVAKTLEVTREHFTAIYGRPLIEARTFSSQRLSDVRQFSGSSLPQLLLMNIDAFNKASNLINKPSEGLGYAKPIELIAGCRPIVILDEPQNFEGEIARNAIASLDPATILRYSATHRVLRNPVYRLGPMRAYELRLVKRIEVLSVVPDRDPGRPYVELKELKLSTRKVQYRIELDERTSTGVRRRVVSLTGTGHDLFALSSGLPVYSGLRIAAVDAVAGAIELSDGSRVERTANGKGDELMRAQIFETVREHLEKELAVTRAFATGRRLKVLSLFFIDRVANYVPAHSKIRVWFEEAYELLRAMARYAELHLPTASTVHGGYFSTVRGRDSDTSGDGVADEDTYALIMKDKERLLSLDEPLRFIFSHSALREGWDNPNVFQICTLNETRSEVKKRQEIGRGMRLPVDERGMRVLDPAVNFLTVVANESYESFARQLQAELEEETGASFPELVANRRRRHAIDLVEGWSENDRFRNLWKSIAVVTEMKVEVDVPKLVESAATELANSPPIQEPQIVARRAALQISNDGVKGKLLGQRSSTLSKYSANLPDPLSELQKSTGLSRQTIATILRRSGRLPDFLTNSDLFLEQARQAIESALIENLVDGVSYKPIAGALTLEIDRFASRMLAAYEDRTIPVTKSIVTHVEVESGPERKFVTDLEAREDIRMFVKLPRWFAVPTPAGEYWPDWGIVKEGEGGKLIFLVRETKSTWESQNLRGTEIAKIRSARKHFAAIAADFAIVTDARQV